MSPQSLTGLRALKLRKDIPNMSRLVFDTSILIDLRKACSLQLLAKLPVELVTTNIVFDELKGFTSDQINQLVSGNLRIVDLSPKLIDRLDDILENDCRGLSGADASLYVLAEDHSRSILLTGDRDLRNFAQENGLEVHGTIWLFKQFIRAGIGTQAELRSGLQRLKDDSTVWLPNDNISELIEEINASWRDCRLGIHE